MHINSIIDADRPSNSQEQKLEKAAFCIVTVLFAVIALYLSSFHAFWSTDSAARFVMVQNFVEHGSLIKLNYPSRPLDPAGEINPYSYYLLHRAHDFVPQYEPLFPLLSTLPYRIFGFFGLTIIPLLSGIGTVYLIYLTTKLLDLKLAPYVPLAVGLGTPVIVYSVVFWDHSLLSSTRPSRRFGRLAILRWISAWRWGIHSRTTYRGVLGNHICRSTAHLEELRQTNGRRFSRRLHSSSRYVAASKSPCLWQLRRRSYKREYDHGEFRPPVWSSRHPELARIS